MRAVSTLMSATPCSFAVSPPLEAGDIPIVALASAALVEV